MRGGFFKNFSKGFFGIFAARFFIRHRRFKYRGYYSGYVEYYLNNAFKGIAEKNEGNEKIF